MSKKRFSSGILLSVMLLFAFRTDAEPGIGSRDCSYELQIWNVDRKASGQVQKVRHAYSALKPDEIDPATGCTVCTEDQERIDLPPLPSFSVCSRLAPKIRAALQDLIDGREQIHSIVGYHVIKSRGPVDHEGNRTAFSNHSFGTAIDINPGQNGLYDDCVAFGPGCRLLRGGPWRPGTPGTVEKDGEVVLRLKQEGFRWGGEIAGKQKDFMHFSLTGY